MRDTVHSLLCFGDSNTFGWDPRGYFGGRYGADIRWTERLAAATGVEVRNDGVCGRTIPKAAPSDLRQAENGRLTVVMLGSNDLLSNPSADAESVSEDMRLFLQQLSGDILLVAPPPMAQGTWTAGDETRLLRESKRLGNAFRMLAQELQIPFTDSGDWKISLTFDGVHFTEEGHLRFAEGLLNCLREMKITE